MNIIGTYGKYVEQLSENKPETAENRMAGGCSKNRGLVKTLEERLGSKLVISDKA